MGRVSQIFTKNRDGIREIASRYPVTNLRVFGSVLRGDDCETSDIDLLVDPLPGATLLDLGGLQDELQQLLGVRVDLVTPNDLTERIKAAVISEAMPV